MFRRFAVAVAVLLTMAGCHPKPQPNANAAFLAKNAKEPGVVALPDGLQYKIVSSGPPGGEKPRAQDEVKVNYEGRLATGSRKVFDSSFQRGEPATFGLQDGLITGWVEVMQLMRPGDEWLVWIPPELGYGKEDHGPIPGNSVLEFRIQLLGVLKHDGAAAQG